MPEAKTPGWRTLIVPLAGLACAGTWAAGQARGIRDRSGVAGMTEKMKTVRAARYLVDVPGGARSRLSGGLISGFSIGAVGESEAAIRHRVRSRGEDDIPTAPGLCAGRGVFVDPLPPHTREQGVFRVGFSAHCGAESTVHTMLRFSKLRSAKRNIASLHQDAEWPLWDRISSGIRRRPATLPDNDRRKQA